MSQPLLPYQSAPLFQRDAGHIQLLAIFSYVWGGLTGLGGFLGIFYLVLGITIMKSGGTLVPPASSGNSGPPPGLLGGILIGMGIMVMVLGWTVAGLNVYSARSMQLRKRRTLSLVVAGINCLSIPFGTALGVFTFVVLLRDSVEHLYSDSAMMASPPTT